MEIHLLLEGEQVGPLSEAQVRQYLQDGLVSTSDLASYEEAWPTGCRLSACWLISGPRPPTRPPPPAKRLIPPAQERRIDRGFARLRPAPEDAVADLHATDQAEAQQDRDPAHSPPLETTLPTRRKQTTGKTVQLRATGALPPTQPPREKKAPKGAPDSDQLSFKEFSEPARRGRACRDALRSRGTDPRPRLRKPRRCSMPRSSQFPPRPRPRPSRHPRFPPSRSGPRTRPSPPSRSASRRRPHHQCRSARPPRSFRPSPTRATGLIPPTVPLRSTGPIPPPAGSVRSTMPVAPAEPLRATKQLAPAEPIRASSPLTPAEPIRAPAPRRGDGGIDSTGRADRRCQTEGSTRNRDRSQDGACRET